MSDNRTHQRRVDDRFKDEVLEKRHEELELYVRIFTAKVDGYIAAINLSLKVMGFGLTLFAGIVGWHAKESETTLRELTSNVNSLTTSVAIINAERPIKRD